VANVLEVRRQIEFHLDQLSVHNGHHAFEAIREQVVRTRFCSNVVPATGPVSAGGTDEQWAVILLRGIGDARSGRA
jgi:hypothetical protein